MVGFEKGRFDALNLDIENLDTITHLPESAELIVFDTPQVKVFKAGDLPGGSDWEKLHDIEVTTSVSSIDISTLVEEYKDLYISTSDITTDGSTSGRPQCRLSRNSGVGFVFCTFLSVTGNGTSNPASIDFDRINVIYGHAEESTTARSFTAKFENCGESFFTPIECVSFRSTSSGWDGMAQGILETSEMVDFLRIELSAGNIRGDIEPVRVQVFGRGKIDE